MKYFSLFSGIGGFELGIQQAYDNNRPDIWDGNTDLRENLSDASERKNGIVGIEFNKGTTDKHVETITRKKNRGGKNNSTQDDERGKRLESTQSKTARAKARRFGKHTDISEEFRQPTCVGFSEIDKYATQIYEKHFPEHRNFGDITKITAESIPDFDLLCGGFPCQAFSIAGKRRGFNDTRGTLFFDIARILKTKQPRLLLLENVKGLLSHDNGNTFKTIIATLTELGYDLQWQVLNSKNFGVPQNRERVYIIGNLRGTPRPQVFPIGVSNHQDIVQLNQPRHSNDRIYDPVGLSPTLNTMQGGRRQPKISYALDANYFKGTSEKNFLEKKRRQLVYTPKVRRLTPLECERLQGFPDKWTETGTQGKISDTQRYKTLGNAVTVNVIKYLLTLIRTRGTI